MADSLVRDNYLLNWNLSKINVQSIGDIEENRFIKNTHLNVTFKY